MRGKMDASRSCTCISICQEGGRWGGLLGDSAQECQILSIMDQSEQRLQRSSFLKRRFNDLSAFLINEMGMESSLAHSFLQIHRPANLQQTLDLLIVDEEGFINHFFIPPETEDEQMKVDRCLICQGIRSKHIQGQTQAIIDTLSKAHQSDKESEQLMEEIEEEPKKNCDICYIEVIENDMVKIHGNLHDICLQCMEHYLREEIGNMRVDGLGCPHCGMVLPNDLIRDLVDLPTYNKYRQFLRNMEIQKNPHLKWCPNSKCAVVVNVNPKKKTSKCPKCGTLICNRCNREAHPKSSCDGAFKKEIKNWQNASDIQKCKKCNGLVQKIAGCNHMTCSVCHYQWCWLCGSEYSNTHFSPLNPFGCPGLQDRPRDDWGKCKIIMLRVSILLLIILGFPVMLPVAMVAVGPILTIQMLYDRYYPNGCCKKSFLGLFGIIVGLIANPFVWIGCIFYLIPKGITRLCEWYRERREEENRINNFLQERLLSEQVFQEPITE